MVKATLLDSPMPDKYPEVHFDVAGLGLWVHFEDDEYEDWTGVFGPGDIAGDDFAIAFSNGSCALISSKGKGYVVDVNTRQLTYRTDCRMLFDAIAIPDRELIIACDYTSLYAYSCSSEVWHSLRIASDEIEFINATPDALSGRAFIWGDWQTFRLDLDSWQMMPDLNADTP
jgi:hypothetical protein